MPTKKKKIKDPEIEPEEIEDEDLEEEEEDIDGCGKKKKKTDSSVLRIDRIDAPTWMTDGFERTPEGFLKGRAVVTNVGVFTYTNPDGSIRRELRLPEEVFDSESVASLKLKPLTNDHPQEIVTDKNVKRFQVGSLGSNPSKYVMGDGSMNHGTPYDLMTDGYHLAIDMIITEEKAIEDVLNGKRELSCGYSTDLEQAEAGAVWMGVPYDYIQRNIRYNHTAIVDKARAGDAARIRLDSVTAIISQPISYKINKEEINMALKKINIDGVEYEAEEKIISLYQDAKNAVNSLQEKLDAVEKINADNAAKLSTLEAERDTAVETVETLGKEIEKLKADSLDEAKIQERIDHKMKIHEAAKKAKVEVKKDDSDEDVQKAVIHAIFPKANLDGKDPVYIEARFEAAVETLEVMDENDQESKIVLHGDQLPGGGEDRVDSRKAREKMIQRNHDQSRGIEQ